MNQDVITWTGQNTHFALGLRQYDLCVQNVLQCPACSEERETSKNGRHPCCATMAIWFWSMRANILQLEVGAM